MVARSLTAGAVLALLAASAQASQDLRGRTIVSFIRGECQSLVVANRAATRGCRPELIGILYPTEEISFVFALNDGRLISFKGRPGHAKASQTTLKVGQVTVVTGRIARPWAVLGSCVFTGVAAGRNRLQCNVTGNGRRYSASFMTRGDIPARLAF